MVIAMIFIFNNLIQFAALLIFPLTIFILRTKFKYFFNTSFKIRDKKINNLEGSLSLEKFLITFFQALIIILNQNLDQKTALISNLTFALILILHTIICFSFLIKKNEKIKFWNNLYNIKFIILITILASQLLFLSWQFHNIVLTKHNNLIWIIMFYGIFLFFTYKVFNQALSILKYLIFNTFKILISKKSNNFYFNQKNILNFYSKTQAIANLWTFETLTQTKEINKEKINKIIKENWILFIIAWRNLFNSNIIKTQKIIINGWKISLIE